MERKSLRRVKDFFVTRSSQLRLDGCYLANERVNIDSLATVITLAWAGTLVPEKIEFVI